MTIVNAARCGQSWLLAAPSVCSRPVSERTRDLSCERGVQGWGLKAFCGGAVRGLEENVAIRGAKRAAVFGTRRSSGFDCRADLTEFAEIAPVTAAIYGASLLGGGLFAYSRTGSKGSLGGGVTGGIALGVAYFLMQGPETQNLGQAIGFGSALLFAAVFGIRLAATRKPLPSGALLVASTVATIIFANAYFQGGLPVS